MVEGTPKAKYREMREVRWRQKRCSKSTQEDGKCCIEDRISMLPDDLLSFILSHITLKEQIATSILSRRWKYLWTLTTSLDFDGVDSLVSIYEPWPESSYEGLLALEKAKLAFVSRVNHVLESRSGSTIKDFKVYFDLEKPYEGYINEWLIYALAWKVERLELKLHAAGMQLLLDKNAYALVPERFISHRDDVEVGFKHLKTISLSHVGVDGKALEFLLHKHNCPLLEDLSVTFSWRLLSLRVTGASCPSLKRLEISTCVNLESLEICDATNLVCFKYSGREGHFLLQNLPMLTHLCVTKSMLEYMKWGVSQFSSILEQLETFHVDVQFKTSFVLPVEMSNLKQLKVGRHLVEGDESLLWLADLIHSAPRLQKFVLESGRRDAAFPERELQRMKVEKSYPELKEVEFVGFCGAPSDFEFVFHFVDNADALHKIIINTKKIEGTFYHRSDYYFRRYNHVYKDARDLLENQIALEKPGIKLDFIIALEKPWIRF